MTLFPYTTLFRSGLLKALEKNFRTADKRHCVRHLHGNMKRAGFTGTSIKEALWNMACASTVEQFAEKRKEMEAISVNAVKWLDERDPRTWSRAFFNPLSKCDMLLNNGCECFNSCILDGRDLGIISMLDWIMEYVMVRMKTNRDLCAERWRERVCPKISEMVRDNLSQREGLLPLESNKWIFSVKTGSGTKYSVNLRKGTCGCRRWDISGIPCRHALACIAENGWNIDEFVNECYHVKVYKQVYEPAIVPINGRKEWVQTAYETPIPPGPPRKKGRPQKARRRDSDEPQLKRKRCRGGGPLRISKKSKHQLKKNQLTCKCTFCGEKGHNRVTCEVRKAVEASKVQFCSFSFCSVMFF